MNLDWVQVKKRIDEIDQALVNSVQPDQKMRQSLSKERARLAGLLDKHQLIEELNTQEQEILSQQEQTQDPELLQLFVQERESITQQKKQTEAALEDLLYPPDELDDRPVFLEVRAGAGGQEAALFAADLVKMYSQYAEHKGWHVSISDISFTDLGGVREATLHIEGNQIYKHLKTEAGVHRVQRVPKTETAGRMHTSTVTVAVLPEAQEVDIAINPTDLRVDTYRASGAGGQHVNKTDSAVRITHIPTGVMVACQEERSQHKNRAKAMKMLQSRLLAAQKEAQDAQVSQQRKEMVGTGMRAEKVRTYNFPQNRITDHQVDITLKNLDVVMQGNLDPIIEPLIQMSREARKKQIVSQIIS